MDLLYCLCFFVGFCVVLYRKAKPYIPYLYPLIRLSHPRLFQFLEFYLYKEREAERLVEKELEEEFKDL